MGDNGLLRAYEVMLTSRLFDEFTEELVRKGTRVDHFHSGIGQEALSVGGVIDLKESDYLCYTHRGVGSLLAKGVSLKDVMFDLFFKDGGTNRGSGSVMHTYAPNVGIVGRNGVFGTRFTIAAGLALAAKKKKKGNITICYYGEAAGARGQYYEAINMCVLWKLPVVFIAENNGFSVNSRTENIFATGNMSDMWRGFDIPVSQFDGNDLNVVRSVVGEAVERARSGKGPSVLEGITYRISPHSPMEKDDLLYREVEEIEKWCQKDPVKRTKEDLLKKGIFTEEDNELLKEKINEEIKKTHELILKAPIIPKEEVYTMIYFNNY